jgi:hypothetical protein
MFQAGNACTKDVLIEGYGPELVADPTSLQQEKFDETPDAFETTMTDTKRCGVLLATFAISLLTPVAYFVAVVAGWIDWAGGLPAAVVAMFLAWTCAIRINGLACSASR